MRFHAGDDTELIRANLYGRYWDIPGGDVKIPGGYQASLLTVTISASSKDFTGLLRNLQRTVQGGQWRLGLLPEVGAPLRPPLYQKFLLLAEAHFVFGI